jgi:predicted ATPase/DNA-binding winged helix-turn-helix (wHTH) protein
VAAVSSKWAQSGGTPLSQHTGKGLEWKLLVVSVFYEIGPFRLDPEAGVLTRDGVPTALGARAVAVLKTLVEHPDEFLSKARILDAAWPNLVVEEGNLSVQVAAIRRVLSSADAGRWIETLPKRGYRFSGPLVLRPQTQASVASGSIRPPNIPEPLTSFIGRERDLVELKQLLAVRRLITLLGIGGIGKTRLALQVAGEIADTYTDGVWLAELASINDPSLVPASVAQALGLHERTGRPLTETLCAHLKPLKLLLILDNCEHLLDACATLVEGILRGTSQVAIIATSREPLRVAGEQTYNLPTLSLPDVTASMETAASSEAVQLFVERVQQHQPGFRMTPDQCSAIAELCVHLDGIPLALELAAARARSLSIEQINARLGDRFRLLTTGSRTALPRHQTLQAAFDWSFQLLVPAERAVLRRLAAFAGSFTLDAAASVVSDEGIDQHAVLDLLSQLVERSLIVADTSNAGGRYRLLETTRAYALEKLTEADEVDTIKRRHAQYFRILFENAPDDWLRIPDADWYARYLPELDNVRAALDWALGACGDATLAVGLAGRSQLLWSRSSLWSEGRQRLASASGQIGDKTPPLDEARLRYSLGMLWITSAPTQALAALERGVDLYRRLGNEVGIGNALLGLGLVCTFMGRFEQAAAFFLEALPFLERAGLRRPLARYFEGYAFLTMLTGDLASARMHFEKALSLYRGAGAESMAVAVLINLADLTWALGDLDAALAGFREAIALIRKAPALPKDMLGFGLTNLAGVHVERGELAEALTAAREGLPLRRATDFIGAMDHLALRAALAGTVATAARIAGFTDALCAAKRASRQTNEARARNRLQALLCQSLSPDDLGQLLTEGAALSEDEAFRLALER